MYIKRVAINNVRSLKSLIWEIEEDQCPGWHVIIGDNGSGKSTFLKAISSVLVFDEILRLRENWNSWLRNNYSLGEVLIDIIIDCSVDELYWNIIYLPDAFPPDTEPFLQLETAWVRDIEDIESVYQSLIGSNNNSLKVKGQSKGLFSSGYGPFRRFTGGDKDYQDSFESSPRLTAHLSIFGEKVALTECLDWLQQLRFKQLEKKEEGNLLTSIIEFVNQSNFLPFNARIKDISSDGVTFIDGNDCELPVEELSDGYRSILSMTFDLIRQLVRVYGFDQVFDPNDPTKIIAPGVVLIDEIDVHLHPTWQRRIGIWFREHFPKIQFIVTTHSPLICQAASVGTVYRLPQPGSDEQGEMITGQMLDRLVYGNVLDAYGTEVFGEGITRSEVSKEKLARLAQLNQKAKYETLTEEEQEERQQLKSIMSTNPDISN
jgi:predicted ATP-binding protein involved in virulence